jgi:hypothetical protein
MWWMEEGEWIRIAGDKREGKRKEEEKRKINKREKEKRKK